MLSRSIHVVHVATNGKISFFFFCDRIIFRGTDHIFFMHPFIDGHLGCFHVLSMVNNAAVNIGRCIDPLELVFLSFFGPVPGSGIAGSYGSHSGLVPGKCCFVAELGVK